MRRAPCIVAVGGDPGGAEALGPVLSALQNQDVTLRAMAYHQASAIWAKQGISCQTLSATCSEADCAGVLRDSGADLLLVSTSINDLNLERKFTAAARRAGIPSLGVLDFWANYRERFLDTSGEPTLLPDRIAIMDERAQADMLSVGFDAERLVVTGQPAHEDIAAWLARAPTGLRSRVRAGFGIGKSDLFVVFGSQPLARMAEQCGHDFNWLGYSERTVLPLLVTALETISMESDRGITLLVRPHPRENTADYAQLASEQIRLLVSADGDRREVALAADLVAGMNSAFLAEACYLGCVTVSLQPGLRRPEVLPTILAGWTASVYEAGEMRKTLEQLLLDPDADPSVRRMRQELQSPRGATDRILALLTEMLSVAKPTLTTP